MGVSASLRPASGHVCLRRQRGKRTAGGGAICAGTVDCGGKGSDFSDLRFAVFGSMFSVLSSLFFVLYLP